GEERRGGGGRRDPALAPGPAVRRPDTPPLLGKAPGRAVNRVAELITDVGNHLGGANEPVRFAKNLGRPLGNLSDIRRGPVRSTPGRPGALLAPRRRVGSPQMLSIRHDDGAVGKLNLVA